MKRLNNRRLGAQCVVLLLAFNLPYRNPSYHPCTCLYQAGTETGPAVAQARSEKAELGINMLDKGPLPTRRSADCIQACWNWRRWSSGQRQPHQKVRNAAVARHGAIRVRNANQVMNAWGFCYAQRPLSRPYYSFLSSRCSTPVVRQSRSIVECNTTRCRFFSLVCWGGRLGFRPGHNDGPMGQRPLRDLCSQSDARRKRTLMLCAATGCFGLNWGTTERMEG